MKNIIQDGVKFAIKEVDEAGNSMGVGAERFDTEAEAQAFIDGAGDVKDEKPAETTVAEQTEEKAPEAHGAEGDTPDAVDEEQTPAGEGATVGEQATAPENNNDNGGQE